ncbi:hypothetical protein PIB30_099558 [Stylosanthes scabra]|uniref:Uncharacterized protein n=1 Tax=Stylosanthes scabra TaxID=79078 RepID=A0ABU6UWC9_9FABA|nr:hypothetical protein [Stylosanthes scabra]
MWMKLIVCNIVPTRHETTFGIDHILMIYALMKGMSVSLLGVMVSNMNTDPTKSKKHLLPFPMFITKWAEEANVPTYPGDEIRKIPKAHINIPTSSNASSSEPYASTCSALCQEAGDEDQSAGTRANSEDKDGSNKDSSEE